MNKHSLKRLPAILLAVCLIVGLVSPALPVRAEEQDASDFTWERVDADLIKTDAPREFFDADEPEYAEDDEVRVFIALEQGSVLEAGFSTTGLSDNARAWRYAEQLLKHQNELSRRITKTVMKGASLTVNYNMTLLANGMSANVKYGQIEEIRAINGVRDVYIEQRHELQDAANPQMVTAGEMMGAQSSFAAGYTGAGSRVAIIDTGLDTDHPSFDNGAFLASLADTAREAGKTVADYALLDEAGVTGVFDKLHASESIQNAGDLYLSDKVPFAFNYIDKDLDVTHDNDKQSDHGTHVAGIAAANYYVPAKDGSYVPQQDGVRGVAPDAQVFVMKVFGKGGGAYDTDYMAAIEDAIVLGADAINLSLGSSSAGFTYNSEDKYRTIMDNLAGSDTVVSISAGNSGSWATETNYGFNRAEDINLHTGGSPGTYTNALTVASVNNTGFTGTVLRFADVYAQYIESEEYSKPFATLDTSEDGAGTEYPYVMWELGDGTGIGSAEDFEGIDLKGMIVIVHRGSLSFFEKVNNAVAAGAIGVLIANNAPGTISMNLTGVTSRTPAASILQSDAALILAGSEKDETTGLYHGTVTISRHATTLHNVADGYTMSDFSSWGVPGDLSLKPEITAPGGNIYSTLTNGGYGLMSGTSMAAPGVTGMAAALMQHIRENDLEQKTGLSARVLAQSLLMGTATPLMQDEATEYSPRRQGAGLGNVAAAIATPSYILVGAREGNDGKVKAELGDDPERTGRYSFDFTIHNMSEESKGYTFDSSILTEGLYPVYMAYGDYSLYNIEQAVKLDPLVDFAVTGGSTVLPYDFDRKGQVDTEDVRAMLAWINKSEDTVLTQDELAVFDFNEDGAYTTDDAYLYLSYVKGQSSDVDIDAQELTLTGGENATVSVTIELSEDDKAWLSYFPNGMFVDGYIYVDSDVTLSIPVLAFYGNFSDASMFENFEYAAYATEKDAYGGYLYTRETADTNYLNVYYASENGTYAYMPNAYGTDTQYMPERNALNGANKLDSISYSLIRNAAQVKISVVNAETGDEYFAKSESMKYAAFYYTTGQSWENTAYKTSLGYGFTDAEGNALADGTKLLVKVEALPEYNVKNESTVPGTGTVWSTPIVIDNVAPEILDMGGSTDEAGNKTDMYIEVSDNRYVAALVLADLDGTVRKIYDVEQSAAGESVKLENIDLTVFSSAAENVRHSFLVGVVDYADNMTAYRVKVNDATPDVTQAESIALSKTAMTLFPGDKAGLTATVLPLEILDGTVTWSSSDEEIAAVDENGVVTAIAIGSATITATSVATPAVTASCAVTVAEPVSDTLRGVVWDEKGDVYWSEFTTTDPGSYEKLSEASKVRFISATAMDDLLLAYEDTEDQSGNLYFVDPESYAVISTVSGIQKYSTDMAYMPTTGVIFGTYGPYLTMLGLGEEVQFGALDMKLGQNLIGIAYGGTIRELQTPDGVVTADVAYILQADGEIRAWLFADDGYIYETELSIKTGISVGEVWNYNSLFYDYDSDMLYWSLFEKDSDCTELVGISLADDWCRVMGEFPEGVWPVVGLYKAQEQAQQTVDAKLGDIACEKTAFALSDASDITIEKLPRMIEK